MYKVKKKKYGNSGPTTKQYAADLCHFQEETEGSKTEDARGDPKVSTQHLTDREMCPTHRGRNLVLWKNN